MICQECPRDISAEIRDDEKRSRCTGDGTSADAGEFSGVEKTLEAVRKRVPERVNAVRSAEIGNQIQTEEQCDGRELKRRFDRLEIHHGEARDLLAVLLRLLSESDLQLFLNDVHQRARDATDDENQRPVPAFRQFGLAVVLADAFDRRNQTENDAEQNDGDADVMLPSVNFRQQKFREEESRRNDALDENRAQRRRNTTAVRTEHDQKTVGGVEHADEKHVFDPASRSHRGRDLFFVSEPDGKEAEDDGERHGAEEQDEVHARQPVETAEKQNETDRLTTGEDYIENRHDHRDETEAEKPSSTDGEARVRGRCRRRRRRQKS